MSAFTNPVTTPPSVPNPPQAVPQAPPPPAKSSFKLWATLALVAIAGVAAWIMLRPAEQTAAQAIVIPTVKAQAGNIQQVVRIGGQTAAREYANITAPMIRGPEGNRPMVLLKLAKSGGMVKKGDLLAAIDGQSLQDHVDDLVDTVEAAEADVRKREAELMLDMETLNQSLVSSKAEMEKARLESSASEVRTEVERQLLALSAEETAARYKQLQGDIASKKKSHAANLGILKITLERHKRHIGRHKIDLERFTIHSPINGLVVFQSLWGGSSMRQIELGDQVSPGQPFMKVVDPASMMIDAKINQAESEQFRIGQTATIRLDAFEGKTFPGKVFSIGALAISGGRQNFFIRSVPIRVAINGVDPHLIPDLSGSGDVIIGQQDSKVIVPLGSVKIEKGKATVAVKTATGFENRSVELGIRNETHAAVVSGLKEGDEIRASF